MSWLSLSGTVFQGTPPDNELGTSTVTLSATDDSGTESRSFDVTVVLNEAPVVDQGIPDYTSHQVPGTFEY